MTKLPQCQNLENLPNHLIIEIFLKLPNHRNYRNFVKLPNNKTNHQNLVKLLNYPIAIIRENYQIIEQTKFGKITKLLKFIKLPHY